MRQAAPEPVQFSHHKHIAISNEGQGFTQAGAVGLSAIGAVLEHLAALGHGKGIELQRVVLFCSADAGVADVRYGLPI